MRSENKYWVVIPAAGTGSRMGTDVPKQYLKVCGQYILDHTIKRFLDIPIIEGIVVAISDSDTYWSGLDISKNDRVMRTHGGQERYHSVLNGLKYLKTLANQNDWVLVHDSARPCLRKDDIHYLISELRGHSVGGLLALPVRDTMKRVDQNNEISATIERRDLWHALTPQMFRLGELELAIEKSINDKLDVTDEAQAMEYSGVNPKLVQGHPDNIKITTHHDLALAELFLKQQDEMK